MDKDLTDCTLCDDCECGHSRCRHDNTVTIARMTGSVEAQQCLGVDPTTNHRCDCNEFVRVVKEES